MFKFFTKKQLNVGAAEFFWKWFEEHEIWIIECLARRDHEFIWAIDERLKPVFPYFKGELEFQLGYNNDVGEFMFFHFGNKELIRDSKILGEMMPDPLKEKWKFICKQ